jgi:serine/threonine protein kinase
MGTVPEARFAPGAVLGGRYRIIAIIGKGGMGEVYRADDMVLAQPVALKFLPDDLAKNPEALARFLGEVRTARQVSHNNVCRVYDVGEADGLTFLSMEYIDGEDLASLLRRIGRLPGDKAVEIARQLCAGLAAAHRGGVLHRDLKPANVMLDGRGRAVITDFGLAGLAGHIDGAEVRSGTPAYMAPEQLAGKEVTEQSDIYSLGLVLYEIFTGKRAFDAKNLADLLDSRSSTPVSRPSSIIKDMDPAVERVILRCLEADPAARPPTAIAVAAALPGGDPLAAALAAGETPSPQMVAASGETVGIRPAVAMACLAAILVILSCTTFIARRLDVLNIIRPQRSPEVLGLRAQEILSNLGYTESADSYSEFNYNDGFPDYITEHAKPHPNWRQEYSGRLPFLYFMYRQSPDHLVSEGYTDSELTPGVLGENDPPAIISGMGTVRLDKDGRLLRFEAMPPQKIDNPETTKPTGWNTLFSLAGLDPTQFKPADPEWFPLAAADVRKAWTGTWPGSSWPLRVEGASLGGKPVFFSLIGPWDKPARMTQESGSRGEKIRSVMFVCMSVFILVGAVLIGYRNYKKGRSDAHGGLRLAAAVFVIHMIMWVLRTHFVASAATLGLFVLAIATSLFWAALLFTMYLSLEPFVRRHWPQSIISWSRLVAGQLHDPLVGRDVLYGVLMGMCWSVIFELGFLLQQRRGAGYAFGSARFLMGVRSSLGYWVWHLSNSISGVLLFFFILFVLRMVLRKQWLAAIAFMAFWTALKSLGSDFPWIVVPTYAIIYGIAAAAAVNFGLITLAAAIFTVDLLLNVPYSTGFSAWYSGTTWFVIGSVVAIAAWGFYTALAGQPLFKEGLFD